MFCQVCGIEAPTKYVEFHQNIGLLVIRFSKSTQGNLCKPCITSTFWSYFGICMVLGWWGIISFFVNIFCILNNVFRYLGCLSLEAPPPGAMVPILDQGAVQRLLPYSNEIARRLNAGEAMEVVAPDVAQKAGVAPGHVHLYVVAMVEASQQNS